MNKKIYYRPTDPNFFMVLVYSNKLEALSEPSSVKWLIASISQLAQSPYTRVHILSVKTIHYVIVIYCYIHWSTGLLFKSTGKSKSLIENCSFLSQH